MSEKRRIGCFKGGCFGLLGCTGLSVLFVLVVLALRASLGVPDATPTHRELEQALPPGVLERDLPPLGSAAAGAPGRVVLDLGLGEREIVPGPPGTPIRVEADFDESQYEIVDEFEVDADGAWEYRISFGRSIAWFRQRLEDQQVRVRIVLPRGVAFALEGKIGVGESRVELGGLWLTDVDLEFDAGEHRIEFGEPLVEPLGLLRIASSVGEMRLHDVGNASPAEVRIAHRIGELQVGLEGDWREDSEIRLRLRIGELSASLPDRGVRVELDRGGILIGERRLDTRQREAPPDAPTLRVRAANSIGELRIGR